MTKTENNSKLQTLRVIFDYNLKWKEHSEHIRISKYMNELAHSTIRCVIIAWRGITKVN